MTDTGFLCAAATPAGTVELTIDSTVTPLHTPPWHAWERGVRRCRQMAKKRGKNRLINGLPGRRGYDRVLDEWTFDMDMTFIGHYNLAGTAIPFDEGLDININQFETNVVLPDVIGTLVWTAPGALYTATALVIVEGLVDTADPVYGVDAVSGLAASWQDFTLTLTLPAGRAPQDS